MKIELEEYNDLWPEAFENEKTALLEKVGEWLYGEVEHVGSTSVQGLTSKPIIDIMFGVKSLEASLPAIAKLSEIEYCYYPYKPEVMHWFCKPKPEYRTHHLHLIPFGSELWYERIKFRDMLRSSSNLAKKYAALKLSLAQKNPLDREAYTENKWPFIKGVLNGSISS